jgi:metal-sulfur cluster biosynthetic enzyme
MLEKITEQLQTIFDPEFPIVDIRTMGLIYDIRIDEKLKHVHIVITFTTPACPAGDQILEQVKQVIEQNAPDHSSEIELTFEPMRNLDMIKDPDLRRMFD